MQYIDKIPEVKDAVGAALLTLGDGNWKMGEGMQAGKTKLGQGDEQTVLEHYIRKSVLHPSPGFYTDTPA